MFGGLGGLLPYVSLYYLDRGLDYREIGALLSANALVVLLAGPLWGSLSDALRGSPRVLLAAGALAVAGVAALALATSFTTILLCNVAIGGGTAGILPILDARALESSGEQRAGWGRLRAWGSAGWVASSLLTGLAIEGWGHGSIFVIAALGFATAATLASGLVPVVHAPAERPLRAALRLFATRSLGLFLIGALLANIAMAAALDFITPRFNELGASAILVGIAWALPAAIEVPVMAGFPPLARRVGGTRLLVAGAVFLLLRTALAAIAGTPELLVAASAIGGIGYGLFTVGAVTYVARHMPPRLAATGQGIYQGVAIGLSGVVAAAAGGLAAGSLGIAGMFALAAAVGLLAAGVVAFAVLGPGRQ
jgi:PPP family 3-phenylpropionic acid transporter